MRKVTDVTKLKIGDKIKVKSIHDGPCYITAIGPIQCDDMRQVRVSAKGGSSQIWLCLSNGGRRHDLVSYCSVVEQRRNGTVRNGRRLAS